jgi:hypothetical protein
MCIRRKFGRGQEWVESLSPGHQAKLFEKISQAKQKNSFIDALLLTEFGDKVTIINRAPDFRWEKQGFKRNFRQIQLLRNEIAHANEYAAAQQAASQVCVTVRLMDKWIELLAAW